ncbi:MAG: apolipoprotein N-acyltransferase, partial [Nannocystaceae bacterium]
MSTTTSDDERTTDADADAVPSGTQNADTQAAKHAPYSSRGAPPMPPPEIDLLKTRTKRVLACVACATCMVLASPDQNLWWLGFIGWIPWLAMMEGAKPKTAFWYGWLTGIITVFWGFIWLTELLTRFAGFTGAPAYGIHLLFAAAQGLQWAIPAALIVWLRRRTGRDVLLLAPLCWVAGEALLPHVFPSYLALMWCFQPLWLQTAEIGGVTTIGLVQLLINAGLYVVLRDRILGRPFNRRAAMVFGATMVAAPSYGAIRMKMIDSQIDAAPKVNFGVVQGNFGITQWGHPRWRPRILKNLQTKSAELELEGADILLWGETAYPYSRALARENGKDLASNNHRRVRRAFTKPLIFGIVTQGRADKYPFNSATVLHEDGTLGEIYDKVFPLYFGEYVPLVEPDWYLDMVPAASYINPGSEPVALSEGDYRFGPLICYEDILPRFARDVANTGIHAFVNLTNDSWFGQSKEQHQHMGLAVLRAIENRRGVLRSVNAGTSVYIDPNGRVVHETPVTNPDVDGIQEPDGFIATVPMMDPESKTLYTRTGELF